MSTDSYRAQIGHSIAPPRPPDASWRCKCGSARHQEDVFRCEKGHPSPGSPLGKRSQFQSGHWAALKHAQRSDRWPPELEVLKEEVEDFLAQTLPDEGDDLTVRRRSLLEYRARLHRRVIQLDSMLELKGLLDPRGHLRTHWINQLVGLVERCRSLDVTLGLARRSKRVRDLHDVLAEGDE